MPAANPKNDIANDIDFYAKKKETPGSNQKIRENEYQLKVNLTNEEEKVQLT